MAANVTVLLTITREEGDKGRRGHGREIRGKRGKVKNRELERAVQRKAEGN